MRALLVLLTLLFAVPGMPCALRVARPPLPDAVATELATTDMVVYRNDRGERRVAFRADSAYLTGVLTTPPARPGIGVADTGVVVLWHEARQAWVPLLYEGRHRAVAAAAGRIVENDPAFLGGGWLDYELQSLFVEDALVQSWLTPVSDSIQAQRRYWDR